MRSFISVLFFLVSLSLFSQNNRIDSLQNILDKSSGKDRILVLNELAIAYWNIDALKSEKIAKEALALEDKYHYFKPKARTYNIIGIASLYSNNLEKANGYYDKCIETAEKYGTESDIHKAIINKLHLVRNGYDKDSAELCNFIRKHLVTCIDKDINSYVDILMLYISIYYLQSKSDNGELILFTGKLLRKSKNKDFQAAIITAQGDLYKLDQKMSDAIKLYNKAIEMTNNGTIKYIALMNIGNIYLESHKYKESIPFFNDALQMIQNGNVNNSNDERSYYISACLGASYLELKEYNHALQHLKIAIKSKSLLNRDLAGIYNNIGCAFMYMDSLSLAEGYIDKAYSFCDDQNSDYKVGILNTMANFYTLTGQDKKLRDVINKIVGQVDSVSEKYIKYDNYKLLGEYYERTGDYKKSIDYIRKSIVVNELIKDEEFQVKLSEFQAKYDTDKLKQTLGLQNVLIKGKNKMMIMMIIAGIILFLLLFTIAILYNEKNKAYKRLVLQSLETINVKEFTNVLKEDNPENNGNQKDYKFIQDHEVKLPIRLSLKQLLESEVYFENNLTLDSLAERCHTNRTYLSQIIHEDYNSNFNTFINTLRVNEAKKIMLNGKSNIPLKELYKKLGFNSYSVFNESFKKATGVTPAFYFDTLKECGDQIKKLT